MVKSNVSDLHVASFFRTDDDILEDGDHNTQSQKNFKSREFYSRISKFLSFERVRMLGISVLSLIGFPIEFLMKILSAMLTLRILSPLDFAVITVMCCLFN